jgi:hypothetical protein
MKAAAAAAAAADTRLLLQWRFVPAIQMQADIPEVMAVAAKC